MTRPFHLGYRPELDGMRAVAVLAVMGFHFGITWMGGGFLGVDVFFVLSGFLITSLLLEERAGTGRISLPKFYARRALRLFPALWVLLLACAVYAVWWQDGVAARRTFEDILITLGYAMNWFVALSDPLSRPPGGLLDHTWSLAIEEQFYLLWPLVLLALYRFTRRPVWAVLAVAALGVVVAPALRLALLDGPDTFARVYNGLDTRADALLAGCFLAALAALGGLPRQRGPARTALALAGGAAAVVLVLQFTLGGRDLFLYRTGLSIAAVASAVCIAAVVAWPRGPAAVVLRVWPLVAIGRISYALYLWHWPVRLVLHPGRVDLSFWPLVGLWTAVSFALAIASFFLVERPALRLKARLGGTAGSGGRPSPRQPASEPGAKTPAGSGATSSIATS